MGNIDKYDLINGIFEIGGGVSIILSILKLFKDKDVKGINWLTILFFISWGFWNLKFYPAEKLNFSLISAIFLGSMNIIWMVSLIYFQRLSISKKR